MLLPMIGRRWAAVVVFVFLAASLAYIWFDHLAAPIERTLPIFTFEPKAPLERLIHCPYGLGETPTHHDKANATDNGIHARKIGIPSKIVALVFYGRRETVSIMDCYLKRNLAKNGGLLTGVLWLERTKNEDDLALLDTIIESEEDYSRRKIDLESDLGFGASYENLDDDTMYIKMDDDVVFIEDGAIAALVCTKAMRPEYFMISANIVNQPMISWLHWSLGVIKPYLPEVGGPYKELAEGEHFDWRPSKLPDWSGPSDFDIKAWNKSDEKHRWLPVRGRDDHILDSTPIEETEYDPFGKGLTRWQIAAQEHHSFFDHLEADDLWKYKFNIWDFQYKRVGIQFVALMGRDINAAKPIPKDDEDYLAVQMPRKFGRHAVADGRGLVVHYGFGPQVRDGRGLKKTDILDRYRAYAKENICASPMLWSPPHP